MQYLIIFLAMSLAGCAAHVVDEGSAANESVEQQIRHIEDRGMIPTWDPNRRF
jgi:hypothetical protein